MVEGNIKKWKVPSLTSKLLVHRSENRVLPLGRGHKAKLLDEKVRSKNNKRAYHADKSYS